MIRKKLKLSKFETNVTTGNEAESINKNNCDKEIPIIDNDKNKITTTDTHIELNPEMNNVINKSTTSNEINQTIKEPLWKQIHDLGIKLSVSLKSIKLNSIRNAAAVYNPLEYGNELHSAYLEKFLHKNISVLFIGMNPGPWGMCQTGIPFGYIPAVRDWMQLSGNVFKPPNELNERPVTGLLCDKLEISGQRFWGLFQNICGSPDRFFKHCFVHNYCPLAFFTNTGRNITPAEIKSDTGNTTKKALQQICNQYLINVIDLIKPKIIICVGKYVDDRIKECYKCDDKIDKTIVCKRLAHPSPRSLNNTNWQTDTEKWLNDNDIMKYLLPSD